MSKAVSKKETIRKIHGYELKDDYAWMADKDCPEVMKFLESENSHAESWIKDHQADYDLLYKELLSRIKETDYSAPERDGDYYYYVRTVEGGQYPVYCRSESESMENETVLIDGNLESEGKSFFEIGSLEVSRCDRYVCFGVDDQGSESYTLRIKEISSGRLLPDIIEDAGTAVEWVEDGFYYTRLNDLKRPYQVYFHHLGQNQNQDVLVFTEGDEAYFVDLNRTKDRKYILIESSSKTTTECRLLPGSRYGGEPKLFSKRCEGVEYSIDHGSGCFFILTNLEAANFRVMKSGEECTESSSWQEYIGHDPEIKLEDMDLFSEYLVLYERRNGLDCIRYRNLSSGKEGSVVFEDEAYSVTSHENPEYNSRSFRYTVSSPVTPAQTIDFEFETEKKILKKQKEVPGGFDPSLYRVKRLWATSDDGTRIPITVSGSVNAFESGKAPVYLYGYGSYGISVDPVFSSNRISLFDRGVIFAIAHIRGGGEMGRHWYDAGKMLNKENTFNDFIACAEFLNRTGVSDPGRIFISGGSAGGLLVGTALNRRPELFAGAILDVPFVDVLNTMLDDSLPLTVTEYDEWGNPNNPEDFRRILKYSPYDNISRQNYPSVFVTAGWNDSRVQYWEPAKWTAKLKELKTDGNEVYLLTNFDSGHGGPSGRYDFLKEVARDYLFCLQQFGILHTKI